MNMLKNTTQMRREVRRLRKVLYNRQQAEVDYEPRIITYLFRIQV